MDIPLTKNKGLTLTELLVALVLTGFLMAGVYRTFINQQKAFTVQDQVVDMQQNERFSINRMMREIRVAGFGNVSMVLPVTLNGQTFNNVVNPDTPAVGSLTILYAMSSTTLAGIPAQNQITVNSLTDSQGNTLFDTGNRKYVSIGGLESYTITGIDGTTITLSGNLTYNHPVGTPVFGIRAVTYQIVMLSGVPTLERDDNTGIGPQPLADNIDNLQFAYFDANGNPTATPPNIQMIQVTLEATTSMPDPDFKGGNGNGYRTRQIASNIHLPNMGLQL